ncbi:hypothetical protein [Modestobacter sp. KNN46-3]|uniref:hypothetical protein n=1 Tax=Modestobacter sp. KNN46-3 TaxID=2711218 RepID=UPI0013DFD6CB|nr:hypothetical protein [Modestobacter sp. KNN46-3]
MLLTICLAVVFVSLVGLIVLLAGRSIDDAVTLPAPALSSEAVDRLLAAVIEGDDCRCETPIVVGSDSPEPYCDDCGGDLPPVHTDTARIVPVDVQTGLTPEQVRALILDQLRTLDLRGDGKR